jgi:hypothetical protein
MAVSLVLDPYFISILLVVYVIVSLLVAIRRVYFHPLSDIPGPRLAAATSWYAAYYEVWKDGAFVDHIRQLHHIYGTSCHCWLQILRELTNPNRSDCQDCSE